MKRRSLWLGISDLYATERRELLGIISLGYVAGKIRDIAEHTSRFVRSHRGGIATQAASAVRQKWRGIDAGDCER